jgi:hypothetical protein
MTALVAAPQEVAERAETHHNSQHANHDCCLVDGHSLLPLDMALVHLISSKVNPGRCSPLKVGDLPLVDVQAVVLKGQPRCSTSFVPGLRGGCGQRLC